jgi:branched-chain amino acid transport system substrate-binding protein
MKTRWWIIGALAVAAIAVLIFYLAQGKNSKPRHLDIGVIFPLSGDAAAYGEKGQKAIQLALEMSNKGRACGDRDLAVHIEDSAASPVTGVGAFQKLAAGNHTPIVIGDIVSAVTLAVAPVAERQKIVLLSPTSSAPEITSAGEYIYRIWPSDLAEGAAMGRLASDRGFKRVAILYMNNDYGNAISGIFGKAFSERGGQVVWEGGYSADTTDFRNSLTRIRGVAPDALYIAGYFADTAAAIRQARQLGMQQQFLGTTAIEDPKFLSLAGSAAEGMIYPLATGFDAASRRQDVHLFVTQFRQRYGTTPGWVEASSYDAFNLVCRASAQISAASPSGDDYRHYFDQMPAFEGVGGAIKFDKNGDVLKPIVFRHVINGRFDYLK